MISSLKGSGSSPTVEQDDSDQEDNKSESSSSSNSNSQSDSGSSSDSSDQEQSDEERDGEEDKSANEEEDVEDDEVDRSRQESDDDDVEDDDRSRSSRSQSKSGSGSGSGSESESRSRSSSAGSRSGNQLSDSDQGKIKKRGKDKFWENDPEFYGIRRSHRPRYEAKPPKLQPQIGSKRKSGKSSQAAAKRRKISTEDDSSDEEVTRNTRKRDNAVSYKEAESEDEGDYLTSDSDDGQENGEPEPEEHVEKIERVMESREGKKGATGSCTTLYAVEEKGDPNDTLPDDTERERQFLIKWVGWSHLHNTWESLETLQEMKVKGLKILDNFCKKEEEHARWKEWASPEDIEYVECQLELQQELVKSYVNAERVIAEQTTEDGGKEYYVKWESLPYSEATWESSSLLKKRNPESIKMFKKREASGKTPSSHSKCLRYRPKFTPIKSQPDYSKGENKDLILRDYQLDGLNWLVHSWCKENSVILADEMGLGKTIQTICFLSYLFETYSLYGPFLLVVPLSTMAAWQKEFSQWAPQINVVTYLGDIPSRQIIQDYEWYFRETKKLKFNAVLTTYEMILKDKTWLSSVSWAAMMVDEAHRLKNGDSLLYRALVDFESNHRLLITGTPLQNSLKELWSLLHFIMPHKFDDWEEFESEHDHSAQKGYTKLHKQLEPFILRRVKKDVEKSLPSKVEQILRVDMTSIQKQYYKWILTKNYTALRKGVKGSVTSFVNVVMELKKCCNHATLIKPVDSGGSDTLSALIKGSGKLMLLDKLLVRLKDTGHRVLIFSQMVMMLDIIAEYLTMRRFAFQRLDGSIKGDLRKKALDHFNAEGSPDFCFLLSTRAGGLGINLATADTVIIFDSDWNPQNDLQAQARAHRIGQKNQVMIYRFVTKASVEEDIVERAKQKMVLDHLVIQRMDTTGRTVLSNKSSKTATGNPFNKDELNAILKFGAEELFKEEEGEEEDHCDIDEILRRAETHEEASRPSDELLSAFKVASFSVNEDEELPDSTTNMSNRTSALENKDWDDIIPEDLRKKVETEEKEKEMADLYLPPRSSRNAKLTDSKGQPLGNEALNRRARQKRKRGAGKDTEESESDDGRPKKRGRPRNKDGVKGFTDGQIRKFLKSLKKFPSPLERIDKLADDSGLIDRSHAELKKLAEQLLQGCQEAIAEQKANPPPAVKEEPPEVNPTDVENADPNAPKKKPNKPREKGPIFKVCGVGINARTLSIATEELSALGSVIPLDESARKTWKLDIRVKNAPYDVDWGIEDDTRLLLGIYEYGMGSWEKIRESDPVLKEKIFIDGDKKPQLKQVGTRADYLLRALKKHVSLMKLRQPKPKKERKPKTKKEKDGVTATEGDSANLPPGADVIAGSNATMKVKAKRSRKKNKDNGPLHMREGADPAPVAMVGDLDPKIFVECKEKMRPVKKALISLDKADKGLSEKDQIEHTKNCLLEIGRQVEICLKQYEPQEQKIWKGRLWYFVSKFTEYDPKKVHHLYKKAAKKEKEKDKSKNKSEKKNKGEKKEKDREKKDRDKKDKEKYKIAKEKKHAPKEDSQSSFHDNSNSSFTDSFRDRDNSRDKIYNKYGRDQERDSSRNNRFREGRDWDRNDRNRYDNERVPSNYDYNFPSSGSSFHPTAPKYSGSSYTSREPSYSQSQNFSRDRAPGDPRGGAPGDPRRSKFYNYDRERDRNVQSGSGRSNFSGNSSRSWDNSYGGRREGSHGYYNSNANRPSPMSHGSGGSHSSYPNNARVAPPAHSHPSKDEWKRSDLPRSKPVPNSVRYEPSYDKY